MNETERREQMAGNLAMPDLTDEERAYIESWIKTGGNFFFRCKVFMPAPTLEEIDALARQLCGPHIYPGLDERDKLGWREWAVGILSTRPDDPTRSVPVDDTSAPESSRSTS